MKRKLVTEHLIGRRDAAAGEDGQATLILLAGMLLAVLAMTVLLVRVGRANDLRSQVKEAADAAALAGASAVRDDAMNELYHGQIPAWIYPGGGSKPAAEDYAKRNGAIVTQYEAALGPAVQITVRSAGCQVVNKSPGYHVEPSCTRSDSDKDQTKDKKHSATATSSAAVSLPSCLRTYGIAWPTGYRYWTGIRCGSLQVIDGGFHPLASRASLARLFDVHLVPGIDQFFTPPGIPPLPISDKGQAPNNRKIAKAMMTAAPYNWTDDSQYECLVKLWQEESSWNENAVGAPTSNGRAFGIPQALPASKIAQPPGSPVGEQQDKDGKPPYPENAKAQISWGLNYIKQRYHSPCSALAFEFSHNPPWY